MKKILATITVSLAAIMATSAMAAPHHVAGPDHRMVHHKAAIKHHVPAAPHHAKAPIHHAKAPIPPQHAKHAKKVNLRVGTVLPPVFNSKNYHANSKDVSKLAKAKTNQKWYKIHDQYVLVNEKNKQIVSILS